VVAIGRKQPERLVDTVLAQIKQPPAVLFSTWGGLPRALEAQLVADKMPTGCMS